MTVILPRPDAAVISGQGAFSHQWYKALTATASGVNGIISGQTIYDDTGNVNAMAIASGATSYTRGMQRYLVPQYTNTSQTVTLNDSNLGAQSVKYSDGTLPAVGQIVAGVTLSVIYNGTFWEVQNVSTSSQAINGNLTVAGNFSVTGTTTVGALTAGIASASSLTSTSTVTATTYAVTGAVAVGSLPSAATAGAGARYFVTDANATTFASVVAAGGSNKVPVYSDGTNWRIG